MQSVHTFKCLEEGLGNGSCQRQLWRAGFKMSGFHVSSAEAVGCLCSQDVSVSISKRDALSDPQPPLAITKYVSSHARVLEVSGLVEPALMVLKKVKGRLRPTECVGLSPGFPLL